jgi:hypothetical protein
MPSRSFVGVVSSAVVAATCDALLLRAGMITGVSRKKISAMKDVVESKEGPRTEVERRRL